MSFDKTKKEPTIFFDKKIQNPERRQLQHNIDSKCICTKSQSKSLSMDIDAGENVNLCYDSESAASCDCSICLQQYKNAATLPCDHTFCFECISCWSNTSRKCPLCRTDFGRIKTKDKCIFLKKLIQNPNVDSVYNDFYLPEELCSICGTPGLLLVCDHCNGDKGYLIHVTCAGFRQIPSDPWYCIHCINE